MNLFPTATKVSTSTTWTELVPFLRTGDIVTVYHNQGEPDRDATVWVDPGPPWVTASSRILRHADGTLNSNVTYVLTHSASGRADDLAPLAASLLAGDVVRATFVVPQAFFASSRVITLEGTVEVDREGDAVLVLAVEDEDGDFVEFYYLTFSGRVSRSLRALEVIDP